VTRLFAGLIDCYNAMHGGLDDLGISPSLGKRRRRNDGS